MQKQKYSDELNIILDNKHDLRPSVMSSLVLKERSNLIAILKDNEESLGFRKKALMALAKIEGKENRENILSILKDAKAPTRLKVTALSALKHLDQDGENTALELLKDASQIEQSQLLRTLAQIGTEKSLDFLDKMKFEPAFLQKELVFTNAIISSRNNKPYDFPFARGNQRQPSTGEEGFKMKFNQISPEELKQVIKEEVDTTYGLSVDDKFGFQINCAGKRILIVLLESNAEKGLIGNLIEAPRVAGLVYHYYREDKSWSLASFILTQPSRDGLDFNLVRRDGEVIYSGVGIQSQENTLEFSATDVERPGSIPSYISGKVDNESLFLENGWSEIRSKTKKVAREWRR